MDELIKLLREAREEKNISLDEISAATKIQASKLYALEKGDFSVFAGEIYLKGVINNYAAVVGLDKNEVDAMYKYARQSDEKGSNGKEKEKEHPDNTVDGSKKIAKEKKMINHQGNNVSNKFKKREIEAEESMSVFSTGVFVLLLLLLAGGAWLILSGESSDTDGERADFLIPPEVITNNDEDEEQTDEDVRIPETAVVLELMDEEFNETTFRLTGSDSIEVDLLFEGSCWIDFHTDMVSAYQQTFGTGDEISASAEEEVWVRLGNPPAVKLVVNGIEIEGLTDKANPHNYRVIISNNSGDEA